MDPAITAYYQAHHSYTVAMQALFQTQTDLQDLEPGRQTATRRAALEAKARAQYEAAVPPLTAVVTAAPPAAHAAAAAYPPNWQEPQVSDYLAKNNFKPTQIAWVLKNAKGHAYTDPQTLVAESAVFVGLGPADVAALVQKRMDLHPDFAPSQLWAEAPFWDGCAGNWFAFGVSWVGILFCIDAAETGDVAECADAINGILDAYGQLVDGGCIAEDWLSEG